MHTISHSQPSSLAILNDRTNSNQILEGDFPGTWMDPRPIKALVLQCTDVIKKGSIPLALGSISQYSRMTYM
jgi:hypothetical protein